MPSTARCVNEAQQQQPTAQTKWSVETTHDDGRPRVEKDGSAYNESELLELADRSACSTGINAMSLQTRGIRRTPTPRPTTTRQEQQHLAHVLH